MNGPLGPQPRWARHRLGPCAVVAHRGASSAHRENTVEAFVAARELGADGIELDVRRTADEALVVHHDPALPDGRVLVETSAAELPSWVPSLDEAAAAAGDLALNVEVKNLPFEPDHDPEEAVARSVAAWTVATGRVEQVLVSSFTPPTLHAVRTTNPEVALGWLLVHVADPAAVVDDAVAAGCIALHPHERCVDGPLLEAAAAAGLAVHTWTVDDADRIRELAGLRVGAVITNVPDVARAALG